MIVGIGTDIVAIPRMTAFWQRHGERGLEKILSEGERQPCRNSPRPDRFLAKRFAAKEALGKALGTGIRSPILMPSISVGHDPSGKPYFVLTGEAQAYCESRGVVAHLSLSDEDAFALAFVVVESR